MVIANIISSTPMDIGPEFKIYTHLDEVQEPHLPTLIVGCNLTKYYFGEDIDYTDRTIDDKMFWTFNKKEMRKTYFNDLEDFIRYAYKDATTNIDYIYVDTIQFDANKIRKIVKKILTLENIITYRHGNMLYLYSGKFIFGVDLDLLKYHGVDPERILSKVKSRSGVFLVGNEILIEYKDCLERLDDRVRFLPFIYSISKDE